MPCGFVSREEAVAHCQQYEDLYQAIEHDLITWRPPRGRGIDQALMRKAVLQHTLVGQQKGVQLGFSGGKAYVIAANLTGASGLLGHHANIIFTYMHVMLELEKLFGDLIPDVEFVITTGDRPAVVRQERLLQIYKHRIPPPAPLSKPQLTATGPRRGLAAAAEGAHSAAAGSMCSSGTEGVHSAAAPGARAVRSWHWVGARWAAWRTAAQGWVLWLHPALRLQSGAAQHPSEPCQQGQRQGRCLTQLEAATSAAVPGAATQPGSGGSGGRPAGQAGGSKSKSKGASKKHGSEHKGGRGDGVDKKGRTPSRLRKKKSQPAVDLATQPLPDLNMPVPLFRFCGSPAHADIRQPIFHFYTKKYQQRLLDKMANISRQWPWDSRQPTLFGRFSRYERHVHPNVTETMRVGANGTDICELRSRDTMFCMVREHMFDIAKLYPGLMDVHSTPKIPLSAHAKYKYLVHLDGQGLSSRLDQLLPMGSLVFKEESGYTAYYHHLLKPYVHYLPFWKKDPLDVLEALKWAEEHDQEARRMGEEAQVFARRYLSKRARTCYWFRLISEFAKLLTYKPSSGAGAMGLEWMHVERYFDEVAKTYEDGVRFSPKIEQ